MEEIKKYLTKYWKKYPMEKKTDPSIKEITFFLLNGGKYYLKDRIFVLYINNKESVEIKLYWCDMKNLSLKEVKDTLKNHKKMIRYFNKKVFISEVKDLFKRKFLIKKENKKWRFL